MKRLKLFTALVLILSLMLFAGCGKKKTSTKTDENSAARHAVITVKDYGTIKLELYPDIAPKTVENFIELANSKFYDGLTFHRIMKGFMIQGGDPEGTGYGGSGKNIMGEFKANGFENNLKHERGVISMARANAYNTGSSQFFIMHETNTSLDGMYAAFGKVTDGMEVVDKIAESVPVTDNNGTVLAENQPIIKSIVITD